jgi:hypothetical protein
MNSPDQREQQVYTVADLYRYNEKSQGVIDFYEKAINRIFPYRVEGEENLQSLISLQQNHLAETGTFLPALYAYSHADAGGPMDVNALVLNKLSPIITQYVMPVSEEYLRLNIFKPFYGLYALSVWAAQKYGYFDAPQVVQAYRLRGDVRKKVQEEKGKKAVALNREFRDLLPKHIRNGAAISLAIEGHRSDFLLPAEAGAGSIVYEMQRQDGGLVVPIGISKEMDEQTGKKIRVVRFGMPLTADEVIERTKELGEQFNLAPKASLVAHEIALLVRDELPEEAHGWYAADNPQLPLVLSGQLKQGMSNGKVVVDHF